LRYKLEGEDKQEDWQYAPGYYSIRYEGLPPGSYRLVLQSSNVSNEFNSPEKILNIEISPPFWQTWWFRILVAAMGIAIIYSIIQYRSRSLRQRNVLLEEKVMLRTKELKHSLEDLRATQAQLIQSEKMASLGELTAGIAHEIQNPLNFVNNFSEVNKELIDELKGERLRVKGERNETLEEEILNDISLNLEKINHHGKRAESIVKGMLQHSRKSTGTKEPTDINALADEYMRLSYHGLRAKDKNFNAEFKVDLDPTLPLVKIIPQDIGRVLLNLFNNAFWAVTEKSKSKGDLTGLKAGGVFPLGIPLKETPPALDSYQPTVTLTTKNLNDHIEIRIADNGPGIPQNIIDKIFQPFFTTKPTGQGTGLGLSLAYDIIKVHGGTITISSNYYPPGGELKVKTKEARPPARAGSDGDDPVGRGEGSEFVIQLPIPLNL
ncbi:MAG: ATP-binding protein, partial [Saprospiraceae bacterium]